MKLKIVRFRNPVYLPRKGGGLICDNFTLASKDHGNNYEATFDSAAGMVSVLEKETGDTVLVPRENVIEMRAQENAAPVEVRRGPGRPPKEVVA